MLPRQTCLESANQGTFDAVVIGAGISGAAVFRELCQRGYRVLLVDRNDFSGGTSQASGMLVWGGLLYLKNLDLKTVFQLSKARDTLLRQEPAEVERLRFRYLPLRRKGRARWLVQAALYAYWLLGRKRRPRPFGEAHFSSSTLLRADRYQKALVYEEAGLRTSDSRFALGRIVDGNDPAQVALNHCALRHGRWRRSEKRWELEFEEGLAGTRFVARARFLINAGGVWADRINEICGIESEYRHVFSKGVYLAFQRPAALDEALVFEMGKDGDSQTFTPWGPVALWGPTETHLEKLDEGFAPTVEDVRFLLDQANRNLRVRRGPEDIVSLRSGVRPLAVKRSYAGTRHPLELSRRHVVARSLKSAAVTLYGGKLTSAADMALEAARVLEGYLVPRQRKPLDVREARPNTVPPRIAFPGLPQGLPDPAWCVQQESCATLEDYMRRRTNLAQWIPRLGLGTHGEHCAQIQSIAHAIHAAQPDAGSRGRGARTDFEALQQAAAGQDQLLGAV